MARPFAGARTRATLARDSKGQARNKDMAKMRAMVVPKVGEKFEAVEREMPEPGAGEMRIRVQACGVCHSDSVTVEGLFPGIQYPRIPGHEVIGVIDAIDASPGSARSPGRRVRRRLRRPPTTAYTLSSERKASRFFAKELV